MFFKHIKKISHLISEKINHRNTLIFQKNALDCGPTCLQMIAKHHGYLYKPYEIRRLTGVNHNGVNLSNLEKAAQQLGFNTCAVTLDIASLKKIPLPAILHWNNDHYVVLTKIDSYYHIVDPAMGAIKLDSHAFTDYWITRCHNDHEGVALILTPGEDGLSISCKAEDDIKSSTLISRFISKRKWHAIYLSGIIITCMILSIFLPWLWKLFYDEGIEGKSLIVLLIIVIFQLSISMLILFFEYKQGISVAQVSNSISRVLTRTFLKKLLNASVQVFEHRTTGDLLQRMTDIERIEELLGVQFLTAIIACISSTLFLSLLFYYQWIYATIFIIMTAISLIWFHSLYSSRKVIDYQLFYEQTRYQDEILDIMNGLTEIKSYGYEDKKLHDWNMKYAHVYKLKRKLTAIGLKQHSGYRLCHIIKDGVIFYLAGTAVINDNISVGILLSISYLLQQMNTPLDELLSLFDSLQDSIMSIERVKDVMAEPETSRALQLPAGALKLDNISFSFPGESFSLENINITFEYGKVTAVIGPSGCGKTTLLNLIFGLQLVRSGDIYIGDDTVTGMLPSLMPSISSFVKQDGYIFAETIKENIIMASQWDEEWFLNVLELCLLDDWVLSLPEQEYMKVGRGGTPISGGQRQRILLARALYRRPQFLLLDEASSALDLNAEDFISKNLLHFSREYNCTIIFITHRLSTLKYVDKIVVMENENVVEQGTHAELLKRKGRYSALLNNR